MTDNTADVHGRIEADYQGRVHIDRFPALEHLAEDVRALEARVTALENTEPPPPGGTVELTGLRANPTAATARIQFETNVHTYSYYELVDANGVTATHEGAFGPGWTNHGHEFTNLAPNTDYRCFVNAYRPDDETDQASDEVAFTTNTIPPIDPPPPQTMGRGAINMSLGGYNKGEGSGYWYSSTPRDITVQNITKMMQLGITHVRGNYAPQWERHPDVIIDQLEQILMAGCTVTLANHSWCTGADPSNHNTVMQGFRRIITAGSSHIGQAITDGRFRIEPWNEPSGHDTYRGGFEASVMHSDRWVNDHRLVMQPLLEIRPDLGFDLGDTHGGNGGRKPTTSCIAAYGPQLAAITTNNLRAGPHYYQGWKPGYWPDFINMCQNHWPFPVTIGEFGGDIATLTERGKGPNHHSAIAYPPADDMLNHWHNLAPHVEEFAMWHAYQSWYSGFVLSAVKGRYAPWEIEGHPRMEIGGRFLERLAYPQTLQEVAAEWNPPDVDEFTRLADTLNDQ